MKVEVNDFHFNMAKVPVELGRIQWLRLKLRGAVKVFDDMKAGWTGSLPFFVFKCQSCGEYALDYPHGHYGRLDCPVCKRLSPEVMAKTKVLEAVS